MASDSTAAQADGGKGVKIMTDAKVQSVEAAAVGAKVNVEIGGKVQPFEAEKVLVAVGRRTDTEALGLDAAGIANDRGRITVNDKMETNVPNVYAIGDCLGKVMLAHVALHRVKWQRKMHWEKMRFTMVQPTPPVYIQTPNLQALV